MTKKKEAERARDRAEAEAVRLIVSQTRSRASPHRYGSPEESS